MPEMILELLKADLGYLNPPTAVLALMNVKIQAALSELDNAGITLDLVNNQADIDLLVMYAAWLYRQRSSQDPMPPMLRYAINNHKTHSAVTEV